MKKLVRFLFILCAIISFFPSLEMNLTAFAADAGAKELWEYETYGEGVVLTKYLGSAVDVYVPSTVEDPEGNRKNVLKLGDDIFNNNDTINSATLGEGITEIGARAFYGCDNLVCIVTPESLTIIGDNAFSGCANFNSIILYDTITSIGADAFSNCDNVMVFLNENTIGYEYVIANNVKYTIVGTETVPEEHIVDGVTYYIQDGYAYATSFDGCLTELVIPSNINGYPVKDINSVFGESNITSIVLPETISEIEDSAFYNCKKLTSVKISDGVKAIGASAFYNCDALTSITIPDGVEIVKRKAFESCNLLTAVVMGKNVKTLEDYAFAHCYELVNVTLSESIQSIKWDAFYNCKELLTVSVPTNITLLYTTSFPGNTVLIVDRDSYAHTFAFDNDLLYFVSDMGKAPELYTVDGVTYFIKDGEAVVLSYDGTVTSLTIPSTVESYPVTDIRSVFKQTGITSIVLPGTITAIQNSAFYYCTKLTNVTFGEGTTKIGEEAFYGCSSLKSITIPDRVTSIGVRAFYKCTALESATIGNGVTSIYDYAFAYCKSLKDLTLGNSVITIHTFAFYMCEGLENLTLPQSVTTIKDCAFKSSGIIELVLPDTVLSWGDDMFSYCMRLERVGLPNTMKTIPADMFQYCTSLTEVTIPNGVTKISGNAFYNCASLKSITIPDSVTSILRGAFERCSALESVVLSKGLTIINPWIFESCTNLKNVTIPNTVTRIDRVAFRNCDRLTQLKIPESVTWIDSSAIPTSVLLLVTENSYAHTFAINNGYKYFVVADGEDPEIYVIDGVTYLIENDAVIVLGYDNSVTNITVPSSVAGYAVTDIGTAFKNSNVESITLPETITEIKSSAFADCTSLTSVSIPDSVTIISANAFDNCTSLTSVSIPDSVTQIGSYAFGDCDSLTSISIPNGVSKIGYRAFWRCDNLSSITFPDSVATLGTEVLYDCINLKTVVLPSNIKTIPSSMFNDCKNLVNITIPEGVLTIEEYAFSDCNSLKNIAIPNSVKTIGASAFAYCQGLTSVVIPDGVTSIGTNAFKYCIRLTSVTFGSGLKSIGESAFATSSSLRNLVIPGNVERIGNKAFYECRNLSSLTISEGVTSIGDFAFYNSQSLSSLVIPDSVTSIGENAFKDCTRLSTVTLPNSITTISTRTFVGCSNLENIVLPEKLNSILGEAFADCTKISKVRIPSSVELLYNDAFPNTTILLVDENSYAHTFAEENNLLYFVIQKIQNPEIDYGAAVSGTVTVDGVAVSGATVEILYDDGTRKETVTTDENGAYEFTYAEVGAYTIRANYGDVSGRELVSIKRMNTFDVYIAGETDIKLKNAYTISGSVSPQTATVTLTDTYGDIIESAEITDGTYSFENVPNGAYIIRVETENGNATREITVFNANVVVDVIEISNVVSGTIKGTVTAIARDGSSYAKHYASVILRNNDGIVTAHTKTGADGSYCFESVAPGKYFLVAEAEEQRPGRFDAYSHLHKLSGSAYVEISETGEYSIDITICEAETGEGITVSGKVTAQGETQPCRVILSDVSGNEVAKCETGNNGKYTFRSVDNGTYFITATTPSDGMGFTVIIVKDGEISGDTDIHVWKDDKVKNHETAMQTFVTGCTNAEIAKTQREWIAAEKRWYDGLSSKEKKRCSDEYVKSLMKFIEWIVEYECETPSGVTLSGEGDVFSGDELESDDVFTLTLEVTESSETEIGAEGIQTDEQFVQQSIKGAAGDRTIAKYYNVSLSKTDGKGKHEIKSIARDTDTTGRVRITMDIPEGYRGYKHYHFVHVHNGVATTLVDLDDDPNTITFEVDRFSIFALTYTDEVLSIDGEVEKEQLEVSEFTVSSQLRTPTISALISGLSGLSDFCFAIDGNELVNEANFADYFRAETGVFTYDVTNPLTSGNHVATISVSDSSGNSSGNIELAFTVSMNSLATTQGAAIRKRDPMGQRFFGTISKSDIEVDGIEEFGMILVPTVALGSNYTEGDIQVGATLNGYAVAKVPAKNIYKETDTELVYTAVLIGITPQYYNREITARAYAKLADGTYVYADCTTRSIYEVAKKVLANPEEELDENATKFIQGIVDYVEGVEITIDLVEPAEGVMAPTTLTVDGYEATIRWILIGTIEHTGIFTTGSTYTANITLKKDGIFSPNDRVVWNGKQVSYTLSADKTVMTIKKAFNLGDSGWSGIY